MISTFIVRKNWLGMILLCFGLLGAGTQGVQAADFTWKGGSGNNFSTAANWINNAVPGAGDNLIFPLDPNVQPGVVRNDLPAGTAFKSIYLFSNGWTIQLNKLSITNSLTHATNVAGVNTISADVTFAAAVGSVQVNVFNPASGKARNQLILTGTVDLGNSGATYNGFGDLVINGTVSNLTGNGGLTVNGAGIVDLTHANNYIGGTIINNGIVIAHNANSLGSAIVTVNATASTAGTLQLAVSNVMNALNLNGFGFGGDGALTLAPGTGPIVCWGNITLQSNSSISVSGQKLTLVGTNGNTTGSITQSTGAAKSLTVVGTNAGVLEIQDTCSYTGVTNVLGATLLLDSPVATQAGGTMKTNGYVVGLGGTLAVDNRVKRTDNRLSVLGNAFVELDGGYLNFNVAVGGGSASSELFAELDLGNAASGVIGANIINLGSFNNTINVGTLKRYPGSTVTFAGTNLGTTNTIVFGSLGTGAALVPATGNALSFYGLLPFATVSVVTGDPSTPVGATDLATHGLNNNTGIGACASLVTSNTGFNHDPPSSFGTGAENIKLNGNSGLDRDLYVNSMNLNGFTINLNGYRLILASGALVSGSNVNSTITFGGHLNPNFDGPKDQLEFASAGIIGAGQAANVPVPNSGFVPIEGIVTLDLANVTLNNVAITQSANLTINASPASGLGKQFLITGTPHNAAFAYTGTTWIVSGGLGLGSTSQVVPSGTSVVIGDNRGGNFSDVLNFQTNVQQLGTIGSPANVEINSTGELHVGAGFAQTIGNLTLRSGLYRADVDIAGGALTVNGNVTSRNVIASPNSNFVVGAPGFPDVTDSDEAIIDDNGAGSLILNNAAGTTLDVDKTPSNASDDLEINAVIGGTANINKIGAGNVLISQAPSNSFAGSIAINGGNLTSNVFALGKTIGAGGGAIGNSGAASFSSVLNINGSGGTLNPGNPEISVRQASSGNGVLNNPGQTSFSASSKLLVHLGNYGAPGLDYDQVNTGTLNFAGAGYLFLDLKGLGQDGVFTGNSGNAQSPLTWTNRTGVVPRFTNVPNETGVNILPSAHILNNPLGFVARVSYAPNNTLTVDLRKPATRFLITVPSSAVAGAPFDVVVKAVDDFGSVDPSYIGTVHFTSTDGQAAFPLDYTFVAGDAGMHTFTLGGAFKTVGNWTMSVVDTVTGFAGTSAVTPVSVGPLALFVVTSPPNAVAGVPTTVTLTAYDAYGNIEFGYNGTVHFSSTTDIQIAPPNDTTLTNGTGMFATTFKTAGIETITATDSVKTSAKGTSNGVLVVPAPVARYTINGPATVVAGHVAVFAVTAFDAFNNLATNYKGTVHITSTTDSGAKLPADGTLTNGTGTFNVIFVTVGSQTATANDTANTAATGTSPAVIVTPAVLILSGPTVYPDPVIQDIPATFSVSAFPANAIITWDLGVGQGTVTGPNPEFIYLVAGTYTVKVTAQDPETGLTDSKSVPIVVNDLLFPNTTFFKGTLEVKVLNGKLRLYPDLLLFQATMPNPSGANLIGLPLSISFNGLNRTVTIVKHGSVLTRGGSVSFKTVNSKVLQFGIAISYTQIAQDASTNVGLDAQGKPKKALIDIKIGGIEGTFVTPLPFVTKGAPGLAKFGHK